MKAFLYYYGIIAKYNAIFSLLAGLLGQNGFDSGLYGFLFVFTLSFLTGGFLFSVYLFNIMKKRQYYFYYNKGLSQVRLILCTYALHLPVIVLPLMTKHYF